MDSEEYQAAFVGSSSGGPISSASFLPYPEAKGPRRSSGRQLNGNERKARQLQRELVDLTNWAVLGLKQLFRGVFSREILSSSPPLPTSRGGSPALANRVYQYFSRVELPPSRVRGEGAIARLQGSEARPPCVLAPSRQETLHSPAGRASAPALRRGDICPMKVEEVALPPPGSRPVPMTALSASVNDHMRDIKAMLASPEERAEKLLGAPTAPYSDPALKSQPVLDSLVKRMVRSGMVRRSRTKKGEVGMFVVVKTVEVSPNGTVTMVQRLIFDQRRDNCSWKEPPWIGLAGPTAVAALDMSQFWTPDTEMSISSGDLPNYYYTLELPEEFSEYFVISGVSATEILGQLDAEGWDDHLGLREAQGEYLALRVPPMGWSWAVVLAQLCLEDLVAADDPKGHWAPERRLVEGGVTPKVGAESPATFVYIDDFGAIGAKQRGAVSPSAAEEAKAHAASHIKSNGLKVHKEATGPSVAVIGLQLGVRDSPVVAPVQEKLWLMVEAARELAVRGRAPTARVVDTVVSTLNWFFLVQRAALSIFEQAYGWVALHRDSKERNLLIPETVRMELGVAAAVAPLLHQNLAADWLEEVFEVDASDEGGAIISTKATIEELQGEAKWASRGGWARVTRGQQSHWHEGFGSHLQQDKGEGPETPYPLPKTLRPHPILVYRFLHLFSGHRRHQDLEYYLRLIGAGRGWLVEVVNVDLAFGKAFDLSCESSVGRFLKLAADGFYDGLHTGPPCSTWSAVRWVPGGPPPLRSRDRPWGMEGLSMKDRETVGLHSVLMRNSLQLFLAVAGAGGSVTMEHPADRGRPPFASIWATALWMSARKRLGRALRRPPTGFRGHGEVTFPQCMKGAPSMKMTTLGYARAHVPKYFSGLQCCHSKHDKVLVGVDPVTGHFRSRGAQAYPPLMCEDIARSHLDDWETRPPLCLESRAEELVWEAQVDKLPDLGQKVPVPEVGPSWDALDRWHLNVAWTWTTPEHNNILEARAAVAAFQRATKSAHTWGKRILLISDSQVTIGALSKGRSSVMILNRLCRRMASMVLGLQIKPYLRYVRTWRNIADGPSRGAGLGYLDQSAPVPPKPEKGDWRDLPDAFYLKTAG